MQMDVRFRTKTLRKIEGDWIVDLDCKRVEHRGWHVETVPGVSVSEDVAAWLRQINEALLAPKTPEQRAATTDAMCTEFYCVEMEVSPEIRVEKVYPIETRATSRSPAPSGDVNSYAVRLGDLESVLGDVRSVLEEVTWKELRCLVPAPDYIYPPGAEFTSSHGMCWVSSACSIPLLEQVYPDAAWKVAGGHPRNAYEQSYPNGTFRNQEWWQDGGMWAADRKKWDGHYWVEGVLDDQRILVDLTADQFGWPPVIVTSASDTRYNGNFSEAKIAKDLDDPILNRLRAVSEQTWSERCYRHGIAFK